MLKDGILVLTGFLPATQCAQLRSMYDQYKPVGSQRDYTGNVVVHINDITDGGTRQVLYDVALRAPEAVKEWYKETHYIEAPFLSCMPPGSIIEPHYDNCKLDGKTLNHTPQRSHSSLIYLSDDHDGGEITFPRQGQTIPIKEGMLVAFPSGYPYLHYVRPIRKARRYSMPIWMTQRSESIFKLRD